MAHFLLSAHSSAGVREPVSEEEMRRSFEEIGRLEAEMRAEGAFVFGGRLQDPDGAKVVRPAPGRVRMTDGPFAESKEFLGGFYIIEAADLDTALEWASRVTHTISAPIEVRPFAGVST
jgi:hypothetical protein